MPSASQVQPLLVVLLVVSLSLARSQDPTTSAPTVASCQPQLLSLVPCAPFVQATTPSPPQSCCDVLNQIYGQQPRCLCLLLNATNVVSIPINSTLALQLPRLCNIPADPSSCGSVPARPPTRISQLGSNSSRSVAAPPAALTAPRPSMSGPHESSSSRVKPEIELGLEITAGLMATTMMTMMLFA